MNGPPSATHFRTCPLCEAACGLALDVGADGEIQRIRGDEDDPFSRGHLCREAHALADLQHDPDRLRRPLLRDGETWREVSWELALDAAADGILRVQRRHGRDAVGVYLGNPIAHDYASLFCAVGFLDALATRNRFSATSVDGLPAMLAAHLMFGSRMLLPVPDLDRADYLLILGANPLVSNGSIMTAPAMGRRLRELRARGGKVVVIDPRRTQTAAAADEHRFIRPGTDALLLLALIHVIFESGVARPGRLRDHVDGWERLESLAAEHSPEAAAPVTGIDADTIRRLAGELAASERAAAYGRVGLSTQPFGAVCCWLVNALNIVTGNLDRPGGAMFARPAVDLAALARYAVVPDSFGEARTRVRGLPEFCGEFPVAALAEEIETPGDGRIRGLVTFAGNSVLSSPNGRRLEAALPTLEWMVSIDPYLNETTRHAHVILPGTPPLERDHYPLIPSLVSVRNRARYSSPLYPRAADARHDWQILHALQRRLDAANPRRGSAGRRARHLALGLLGPRRLLDLALRAGPYGPRPTRRRGLTLARLERRPHGIDLGALEPCLPRRLETKTGRIDLAPEILAADVVRLTRMAAAVPSRRPDELLLFGRRQPLTNNSWTHHLPTTANSDGCTLLMHPDDAERLGVAGAARVEIRSRVGAVTAPLELTRDVMPGTVSLPHGFGHDRPGTRLSIPPALRGVSANDLTDDVEVDAVAGTAVFNGVPVRVSRER